MSTHTQTLEELAEYEYIIQRNFHSEDEGYEFFNAFARNKGFSLRKGKVKRAANKVDTIWRQYVCSKEGVRQPKFLNIKNMKRRPKPLTRFDCPFEVVIKHNHDMNVWYVHKYVDTHNHEMARLTEVGFMFSHRRISELQKKEILAYQTAGLRKCQIMDVMEQQYGGPHNVGYAIKDLYNFSCLNKKLKIADGDANAVLQYMKERQLQDSDFFFDYQTSSEGRLLNLFWCDGQSRLDYQAFGDLVIFDSTYRTNRYKMPFVPFVGLNHHRSTTIFACAVVSHETVESFQWLLRTLLVAMYNKEPRSIITDGDHAMRKAIRAILPNTVHRLCTWHIERNAAKFLHHTLIPGFRLLIYMCGTPETFEARWQSFMKKLKTGKRRRRRKYRRWLSRMYMIRRLWAASYLKNKYFLGAQSNQRSESLNSRLHKYLDRKMTLYDMVDHYFYCVSRIRRTEWHLDCQASQSKPVPITEHQVLETSAAECLTPANFYLVQREIKRAERYHIVQILDNEGSTKYMVVATDGAKVFEVDCYDEVTLENVTCSCLKFECEGIPCCHVMRVLISIGAKMPQCCVLNRWTLNAKSSSTVDTSDPVKSMKGTRLTELLNLAKLVFEEASCSTEEFLRWKEILQHERNQKRKRDEMDGKSSNPEGQDNKLEADEDALNVLDPEPVQSKGAPKKMKSFLDKPLRRCSECKATDHDKRTCPKKKRKFK